MNNPHNIVDMKTIGKLDILQLDDGKYMAVFSISVEPCPSVEQALVNRDMLLSSWESGCEAMRIKHEEN